MSIGTESVLAFASSAIWIRPRMSDSLSQALCIVGPTEFMQLGQCACSRIVYYPMELLVSC